MSRRRHLYILCSQVILDVTGAKVTLSAYNKVEICFSTTTKNTKSYHFSNFILQCFKYLIYTKINKNLHTIVKNIMFPKSFSLLSIQTSVTFAIRFITILAVL